MIKNNEITGEIIGKYFLTKDNLTQKKVSKLVFYAYSWYVVLNNELKLFLFDEIPEAWMHDPIFPSLYEKHKYYNWLKFLSVLKQ